MADSSRSRLTGLGRTLVLVALDFGSSAIHGLGEFVNRWFSSAANLKAEHVSAVAVVPAGATVPPALDWKFEARRRHRTN